MTEAEVGRERTKFELAYEMGKRVGEGIGYDACDGIPYSGKEEVEYNQKVADVREADWAKYLVAIGERWGGS